MNIQEMRLQTDEERREYPFVVEHDGTAIRFALALSASFFADMFPTGERTLWVATEWSERKRTRCPHCQGPVRLELSINHLVCKDCSETLYVHELTNSHAIAGYRQVTTFNLQGATA